MTGLKVGLFILLIIIAAAVTYLQLRPSAEGDRACNPPGESPCGDKWINYAGAGPKRVCLPTYTWATDGYGPQSCKVDCPAGYFPCWDDNKQQGECRLGMTKDAACVTKCSATSCQNGGTCDLTSGMCNCPSGFTGISCEKPIADTCVGKPAGYCSNGKCNPDQGVCVCIPGWYGTKCDSTGACDLNLCRAVDKGAHCADPAGPNPGNCVCSGTAYPADGMSPCTLHPACPPGRGPPGDCSLYEHTGGTFLTDFTNGCYWRDNTAGVATSQCQQDFGSSSLYYIDYCGHDKCSGGAFDRNYCRTDGKWYTTDPNLTDNYMAGGCPHGPSINPAGLKVV
jgi:hypothetical protein